MIKKKTRQVEQQDATSQNASFKDEAFEDEDSILEEEQLTEETIRVAENDTDNVFFYSNSKYLAALDDQDIFTEIKAKYPLFDNSSKTAVIRRVFISQVLTDTKLVSSLLEKHALTFYDFMKVALVNYPSLAFQPFLEKVYEVVRRRKYMTSHTLNPLGKKTSVKRSKARNRAKKL